MCEVVADRCGMACAEDSLLRLGNRTKMVTDDIKIPAQPSLAAGESRHQTMQCQVQRQQTNYKSQFDC